MGRIHSYSFFTFGYEHGLTLCGVIVEVPDRTQKKQFRVKNDTIQLSKLRDTYTPGPQRERERKRGRESGREGERERERERERETDRQTDRQTNRQIETGRLTDLLTKKEWLNHYSSLQQTYDLLSHSRHMQHAVTVGPTFVGPVTSGSTTSSALTMLARPVGRMAPWSLLRKTKRSRTSLHHLGIVLTYF